MAEVEVDLLLFAKAKELLGFSQKTIRLPCKLDTESLKSKLLILYPQLSTLGEAFILAHNEEYIESDQVTLKQGDELAVIPPISGG